ncbi:hypothetical protein Tco_0341549 [Tanacetum coccineum]
MENEVDCEVVSTVVEGPVASVTNGLVLSGCGVGLVTVRPGKSGSVTVGVMGSVCIGSEVDPVCKGGSVGSVCIGVVVGTLVPRILTGEKCMRNSSGLRDWVKISSAITAEHGANVPYLLTGSAAGNETGLEQIVVGPVDRAWAGPNKAC